MLEFLIVLLLGLVAGIVIGLMPGLPAYVGPLVLFPFIGMMSVDQILAFFISSHIGSQYFGSVAAILLKIPGETSAMIYLKDLDHINTEQRLGLVRQTAWGSSMGSFAALAVMLLIYYLGLSTEIIHLSNNNVKLTLLALLMFMICWFTNHKWLSVFMFAVGAFFAEKTDKQLPSWVFEMQMHTTDITLFGLILGFMIIPEFINEIGKSYDRDSIKYTGKKDVFKEPLDLSSMFRGTWIGSMIGLIPGPSHILSSIMSYNSYAKDQLRERIISAESANNSSTITSLLPFLYVGLPITLNEFLLNDLLQVKLFMIPTDFKNAWPLLPSLNFIELCFIVIAVSTLAYHFLAQKFLKFYEQFMIIAYGKLKIIFVSLIAYLVYVDLKFHPVYLLPYFSVMLVSTLIGVWMLRRDISPLPLLFGFLLGDMLAWCLHLFYQINF